MASSRPLENTVIYKLFPGIQEDVNSNLNIVEKLEIAAENYVNKISGFLNRYIWHNEPFNLHVSEIATVPHLRGLTCYDDNVEDEWFIVYLLFFLTERDKNLIVQIEDEDGDFLLIEAAEYLPKWLNPDTSENRIFIYQGALHIIPVARTPSDVSPLPSGTPSLQDSLTVIRNFSSITKASDSIQKAIQNRISGYPHKIDELKHRAHCYMPCAIAAILKEDPQLIAPAVKAFYFRDPIDLKACKAMKFFAPETCVMTEVVFTRCLYAQLSSQEYEPDQRTGWSTSPGSAHMKAYKLGMKLACGFEILAAGVKKLIATDDELDFSTDVRWKRFLKSLQDRGYFRGEVEGTHAYKRLLHQAQDFYLSSLRRKDNYSQQPGLRVQKLLQSVNYSYEEMKENEKQLRPPDDDSWMDITPEVLDSMLEKMSQQPIEMAQAITGGLKTFLRHESGVDGVDAPVRPPRTKKQKINFDADAFTESVNKILDFRIPEMEGDGDSSSMSGYSDDDDGDVALNEGCTKKPASKNTALNEQMQSYMEEMDRELAKTNIGLSFEKLPQPTKKAPLADSDIDSEDDDFHPVDVDLNALKNILESYSSQQGMPGPISTLYNSMGMDLPDNDAS